VVIFYRIWMPVLCPVFLMHVLLCCLSGLLYVSFIELEMRRYSVYLFLKL